VKGNAATPSPETCRLEGKLFSSFPGIMFRHAEADQSAVMAFRMGEKEAALPLQRLGKEFAIAPGSADARMIGLIISALEFVSCLRLDDPLPAEVVSGEASWVPKEEYRLLAEARLQMQLIAWLTPQSERVEATGATLLALAEDPAIRAHAQEAMARAAADLGLNSARETLVRMKELADELAYLEHLRVCFLDRLAAAAAKLTLLARGVRAGTSTAESVSQVIKLMGAAQRKIQGRFDDLDAQTGEIIAALRNLDQQRTFIRAGRDFLYRSFRVFEPHLDRIERHPVDGEQELPALLAPLYHFLAPRFMPVTEWLRQDRSAPKISSRSMSW